MKKIVAIGALLTTVAVFATPVTSDNTFGVLKISDTTSQELIISVPWAKVGGGSVKIEDLVLPSGLTNGTCLYYYNGAKYMSFKIENGAWVDGELDGGATFDATQAIARGGALIIKREKGVAASYPPIYLSGEYVDSAGSSTIAKGTVSSPAYSLIAPTKTSSETVSLNDAIWTNIGANDDIILSDLTKVFRADNAWKIEQEDNTGADFELTTTGASATVKPKKVVDATVPVGVGIWYVSKTDGGDAPTVTWNN